ncbi:MAG: prepilin peptidase [Hungatella sp.]|nr:prepilin peptidase [Hungatella sp.]
MALLGGAWYDIREQRIPNWWCICAWIGGMCLTWMLALPGDKLYQVLFYTVRIVTVAVIWFPLFQLRMMGAGDIKLMALMTGYLGFVAGAHAVLYGFFIGAALAFLKLFVCRNLHQRLKYFLAYIRRLFLTKEPVPYYEASRDGKNAVIPLGFCLFGGYVWYLLDMIIL